MRYSDGTEVKDTKKGDKFIVAEENGVFTVGSVIELFQNRSEWTYKSNPLMKLISGSCNYDNAGGAPGGYVSWAVLMPLGEQKPKQRIL